MKIQIIVFIIGLHYCISQYPGTVKKPYPKKVRVGLTQYNNAGKYTKLVTRTTKTENSNSEKEYTVFAKPFPMSGDAMHHQIVPDSPYFPVDEPKQHERRSRVKKVLPDYVIPARRKRAVDGKDDITTANLPMKTIKQVLTPALQSAKADEKSKILKTTVKTVAGQKNELRSQKRGRINHSASKKPGARNVNLKETRAKKGNKHSRPRLSRSKKRKSQKKLRNTNHTSYIKSGRAQRAPKLKNKSLKRFPLGNNTTKLKAAKTPKGLNSRRLIAGMDAMIEDYPYTVSIQKDKQHWCSGAVLNPRLIITTANCLWRSNAISRMRVRAGSRYTDRGGQVAKIQEVMKHPGWKIRKNPDNDVALAVLDRSLRFSHTLHGVDLPNRAMLPPFDDVWVTSWGSERRDGMYSGDRGRTLQVYHGHLMDMEKCNSITKRFAVEVSDNFICLSQQGSRSPCTRDTGAPGVSDGVLWAMASWGLRKLCGTERFPSMFSYLGSPSNVDFITNATHYLMADERFSPFLDRFPVIKVVPTQPPVSNMPWR